MSMLNVNGASSAKNPFGVDILHELGIVSFNLVEEANKGSLKRNLGFYPSFLNDLSTALLFCCLGGDWPLRFGNPGIR